MRMEQGRVGGLGGGDRDTTAYFTAQESPGVCVVTDTSKAAPNIELSAHSTGSQSAPTEMRMRAESTVNSFPLACQDKGGVGDHMII